jgi:bacterial microcompartment shell protein
VSPRPAGGDTRAVAGAPRPSGSRPAARARVPRTGDHRPIAPDAGPPVAGVTLSIEPALGLLEFDSIAIGIAAGDAMVKRAPVDVLRAGTVHPGRYLVLVGGAVADVEEALAAGRSAGREALLDEVFLPHVHPDVTEVIGGRRASASGEALGIIETPTVASIIAAADAGLKGARVRLLELRLADGLGGKGYLLFDGPVSEVEAAVEIGRASIAAGERCISRVIAQLHREMRDNLLADARFRDRAAGGGAAGAAPRGAGS